jgi:hypothetical protein
MDSATSNNLPAATTTTASAAATSTPGLRLHLLFNNQAEPVIKEVQNVDRHDDLVTLANTFIDTEELLVRHVLCNGRVVFDNMMSNASTSLAKIDDISALKEGNNGGEEEEEKEEEEEEVTEVVANEENVEESKAIRSLYIIIGLKPKKPETRHSGRLITIFLRTMVGRNFQCEIDSNAFVYEIKEWFYEREGLDDCRLIYCGKLLDDNRTLEEFNIQKEATLFIIPRPRR